MTHLIGRFGPVNYIADMYGLGGSERQLYGADIDVESVERRSSPPGDSDHLK